MAGRAMRQSLRCARSVALAVHDLVAFGSLSVCAFEPSRRTGPSCGSDGAACPASHPRTDVGPTGVQRFADSAGSSSSLSSVWPDRRRTPPRRRPQRLPNRTAWDLPDDDRRAGSGDRSSPACPSLRRRRSRGSHGPATAGGARSSFSREPARLLAIVLRSAASLPLELRAPAAGDPLGRSGVWAGCISPPSRRRAPSRECRLGGRVRHTGCPIPGAPCAEQPPSSAATRCRPQSAWESGWWWKSTSAVDCATATSVFFGRPS